jgi:hypothetical protein
VQGEGIVARSKSPSRAICQGKKIDSASCHPENESPKESGRQSAESNRQSMEVKRTGARAVHVSCEKGSKIPSGMDVNKGCVCSMMLEMGVLILVNYLCVNVIRRVHWQRSTSM